MCLLKIILYLKYSFKPVSLFRITYVKCYGFQHGNDELYSNSFKSSKLVMG